MPSNPYKQELIARKSIDRSIQHIKNLGADKGVNYNYFIKNILLEHAVSEKWVKNWIQKYYLKTGELKLIEDFLYNKEVEKK